jgi:hypothetical protein
MAWIVHVWFFVLCYAVVRGQKTGLPLDATSKFNMAIEHVDARLAVHHGEALAVRDEVLNMEKKWLAWNEAAMKEAIESSPKLTIERGPAKSFRL